MSFVVTAPQLLEAAARAAGRYRFEYQYSQCYRGEPDRNAGGRVGRR
ncbi:hypothetical protein MMSP_2800 [Mycobacterium sp. 012931]|nr:hypothetical protein MMSP_2800 [Mycobacterium sp. 012931]